MLSLKFKVQRNTFLVPRLFQPLLKTLLHQIDTISILNYKKDRRLSTAVRTSFAAAPVLVILCGVKILKSYVNYL